MVTTALPSDNAAANPEVLVIVNKGDQIDELKESLKDAARRLNTDAQSVANEI